MTQPMITRHWMHTAERPPIVMQSGQGSWLIDHTGKRYLDFIQGWAVNCLGHCPPEIATALAAQATTLLNCSPAFFNARALELAERIGQASFGGQVFFANSGAEANEGAIKLVRKWGQTRGAYEIITFERSFHGRTLATMSASGKPQFKPLFEPKVPGFVHVPLNDLAAVEAAITPRTVAVMLEPIQGEGGVWPATDEFMRALRELTRARGLALIADEIQTGIGRTGTVFGYQGSGVEPDVMTLGKGLGGGLPIAALVAHESFCCFQPGDQGGTFNGNPLMAAGALAVFDVVRQPAFLAQVCRTGAYLTAALSTLSKDLDLGDVRGRGLLLALELGPGLPATRVVEAARDAGLLLNAPTATSLRFMPALNVSLEDVDSAVATLRTILQRMRAERR
jgi:acetylornithine/N-succinyldiaminopimelate aminotransferase